jgi:hypothetical protein
MTFPNACTITISFKNNHAKSKRIAMEVYMVRAEIEEINVEQQEAGATALTSPQYTKNTLTWGPPRGPRLSRWSRPSLLLTPKPSRSRPPTSSRTTLPKVAPIINLCEDIVAETVKTVQSVKAVKTGSRTSSLDWISTHGPTGSPIGFQNIEEDTVRWLQISSSRRLTINNPQHLPHHH